MSTKTLLKHASSTLGGCRAKSHFPQHIINPTVIVEVLSDSTEKYDRGKKANHYRQIASLKELLLITQDRPHVERFTRQPNGDWMFHEQYDLSADFELKSLGIFVAISELYRGLKFDPIEDDVNASR